MIMGKIDIILDMNPPFIYTFYSERIVNKG